MKTIYLIIILFLLFTLQIKVQEFIDERRAEEGFSTRYLFQPAEVINSLLAAGFRGLAADLLWFRVDEYSHEGQWYKLLPLFETITFLQPKFITAWSVGGWHMAFNLYFKAGTADEKKKWLDEGLVFLKKGIQNNPNQFDLYYEIGWTYFFKAKDYTNSIRYLTRAVHFPHPQYVDHILAHAYERNGQLRESLDIWKRLKSDKNSLKSLEHIVDKQVINIKNKLETDKNTH